jgi:hypothetical protein
MLLLLLLLLLFICWNTAETAMLHAVVCCVVLQASCSRLQSRNLRASGRQQASRSMSTGAHVSSSVAAAVHTPRQQQQQRTAEPNSHVISVHAL